MQVSAGFQAGLASRDTLLQIEIRQTLDLVPEDICRQLRGGSIMELVDNDGIPFGLEDLCEAAITFFTEERLEGREPDRLIAEFRIAGTVADERPISEVDMAFEIFPPRVLNGRLIGQDQDLGPAHLLGKLVGGESLAKAHFRVPQEVRFGALPLLAIKEVGCFINCGLLLQAHSKCLMPVFLKLLAVYDDPDCTLQIYDCGLEPAP